MHEFGDVIPLSRDRPRGARAARSAAAPVVGSGCRPRWAGPSARAALAIALGGLSACALGASSRRKVGEVTSAVKPAAGLRQIQVEAQAGRIRLVPGASDEVSIAAEVWLADGRPQADFVPDFGNHVRVVATTGRLQIVDAHSGAADAADWELRLTVHVPEGLDYTVALDAGAIEIGLVRAGDVAVTLRAGQAKVTLDEVVGHLAVHGVSGEADVAVAKRGPGRGLTVEQTTGSASVGLPADFGGELQAKVSAGDLVIAPRYGIKVRREHAAVSASGKLGAGGPEVRLMATTGQITLR